MVSVVLQYSRQNQMIQIMWKESSDISNCERIEDYLEMKRSSITIQVFGIVN